MGQECILEERHTRHDGVLISRHLWKHVQVAPSKHGTSPTHRRALHTSSSFEGEFSDLQSRKLFQNQGILI